MVAVVHTESAPPSGVGICCALSERLVAFVSNHSHRLSLPVSATACSVTCRAWRERRGDCRECGGDKYARCARDRVAKMFTAAYRRIYALYFYHPVASEAHHRAHSTRLPTVLTKRTAAARLPRYFNDSNRIVSTFVSLFHNDPLYMHHAHHDRIRCESN